jgi:hypothetical protein
MLDKTEKPAKNKDLRAAMADARSAKRDQRDPPEENSKEYRKVKSKDNNKKADGNRGPKKKSRAAAPSAPRRDPPGDQPESVEKSRRKSLSKLAKTLRGKKKA